MLGLAGLRFFAFRSYGHHCRAAGGGLFIRCRNLGASEPRILSGELLLRTNRFRAHLKPLGTRTHKNKHTRHMRSYTRCGNFDMV